MLTKINHLFRMVRDPELTYSGDTTICKIGLVCSEKRQDKETSLFLDGVAFGKTAELINSIRKGQRVFVSGKLKTDQWQDNNGQNRSKIALIVEGFEFVESKQNDTDVRNSRTTQNEQPTKQQKQYEEIDMSDESDEIPF